MVVSSLPAFPVAAFPSNFAAPATYSLNVTAAPQPSIEDLQRALDAAKAARAPVNCCGPKGLSAPSTPNALQAPVPPADGIEGRVEQLETDMKSLQSSMRELIDLVKARK
jgi:hypothetical protein